jgi:hypothetical protein
LPRTSNKLTKKIDIQDKGFVNNNKYISLRKHLIRSASGSLVLKIFQTGLNLALAIVLARLLGVKGIYAFCLSIVQILTASCRTCWAGGGIVHRLDRGGETLSYHYTGQANRWPIGPRARKEHLGIASA